MVHEFPKTGLWPLKVGERHHSRRVVTSEKHRKLIDEVANGGLRSSVSVIDLRGHKVTRNFELITEKADLFWLGFQVLVLRIGKDKIEDSDAPVNVFDFVLPAVADVLAVDLPVEPAGEQVVDDPVLWEVFGARMFLGV